MNGSKYNYDDLAWQKPVDPDDAGYFFAPTPDRAVLHAAAVDARRPAAATAVTITPEAPARKRRFRL